MCIPAFPGSVPVTAVKHAMSSHKKEEECTREGLWTQRTFRQHIAALIVHSATELHNDKGTEREVSKSKK